MSSRASIRRRTRCAQAGVRAAKGGASIPLDGELTLAGATTGRIAMRQRADAAPATTSAYYAAVRDAIRGKGPNPVPPEQAVELMELLDLGRPEARPKAARSAP